MAFLAPIISGLAAAAPAAAIGVGANAVAGALSPTQQYAPGRAPIAKPVSVNQANQAYNQSQDAMQQQAALLAALRNQNGIQNQSDVYNQLTGIANGTGPNPALAMLNQATGQNVANQASLAAGQRGSNANVGLLQRNAANAGVNAQQNAAGQAAILQANQQLNALGAQGNLATQQVGQQQGATNALNSFGQNEQGLLLQSIANQNNAANQAQGSVNSANSGAQQQALTGQQNLGGNLAGAVGTAIGLGGDNKVKMFAEGGKVGPQSNVGRHLYSGGKATNYKAGGFVPGKAQVSGNSYKNDTVDAKLSPGEVVIPRSIMQGKDAAKKAAAFVQAILNRKAA